MYEITLKHISHQYSFLERMEMAVTRGSENIRGMEQILANSKAATCICTLFMLRKLK